MELGEMEGMEEGGHRVIITHGETSSTSMRSVGARISTAGMDSTLLMPTAGCLLRDQLLTRIVTRLNMKVLAEAAAVVVDILLHILAAASAIFENAKGNGTG